MKESDWFVQEIYRIIRRYSVYSLPSICRHFVMLDLLELLERSGNTLDKNLVQAAANSDDEAVRLCLDGVSVLTGHEEKRQ